jgi:hypothetical protein
MKPVKQMKKATTKTSTRKAPVNSAALGAFNGTTETKAARAARSAAPTTIEAHIDVGFGNQLFVRGQGAGLSWDHGVPLKNLDSNTWQWSAAASDKLTFKLLLNDSVWAQGADIIASPGQKVEITPNF